MIQLNQALLRRARIAPKPWQMTQSDCIAINVLKRDGVSVTVLAEVFKCSRNTIYANCITGEAPSYHPTHSAHAVNATIDEMGIDIARERYVTPAMIAAVDRAHRKKIRGYRS